MTLALAVASVGIFGLPPLMDRAMQKEVAANRLADVTVEFKPLALSAADLEALARIPDVAAVEPRSWFTTRIYVGARRAQALVIGVRDFPRQRGRRRDGRVRFGPGRRRCPHRRAERAPRALRGARAATSLA